MVSTRSNKERRIFFPWEGRGSVRRFFARGRLFTVFSLAIFAGFLLSMARRERHAAGVRRTVLALEAVRPMVDRYLLQQEGHCPGDLATVRSALGVAELPLDGWGRPLRLVCRATEQGEQQPRAKYVLMSDGPDGLPGGTDRIED